MSYHGHADQSFGHVTYAQNGEDLMVLNLFRLLGVERPSYLDIGAHHPTNISNTRLLYDRGCRGVNVDANARLIERFQEQRPEDVNVAVGVMPFAGEAAFRMLDEESGRNTFCDQEVLRAGRLHGFKYPVTKTLGVATIEDVVKAFCPLGLYPHFLSIDIEGYDAEVLRSANFLHSRPSIVCAEVHDGEFGVIQVMKSHGYQVYCRLGDNRIFVHQENIWRLY